MNTTIYQNERLCWMKEPCWTNYSTIWIVTNLEQWRWSFPRKWRGILQFMCATIVLFAMYLRRLQSSLISRFVCIMQHIPIRTIWACIQQGIRERSPIWNLSCSIVLCVFYYIVYFVVIKLGKAFVIHTIKMVTLFSLKLTMSVGNSIPCRL